MAKFENMTLSYTQIASIPFQTRKSASGSLLDALSRDLTPGQRVALFPSYVNQIYASGGYSEPRKEASLPPPDGGVSTVPPSVDQYSPPKPSKGLTSGREIIPGGMIPDPVTGKPIRVPDQQKLASNTSGFTPRERAVLDMISRREGSPNPDIIFGDIGGKPGSGKYSKALGLDKTPLSKMSISQVIEIMPKLRAMTKADGYGKLDDGRIVGTSAVGSGQMVEATLKQNLTALGIKPEDYDKVIFDGTLQDKLTLSNFRTSIGDPNDDPSKWNKTQLGNQYESFNVNRGFSPLSTAEMENVRKASPDRPIETDAEFSPLDNVYDLPEEIDKATAEPVTNIATASSDDLVIQRHDGTRADDLDTQLDNILAYSADQMSRRNGKTIKWVSESGGQPPAGIGKDDKRIGSSGHDHGRASDGHYVEIMPDGSERELLLNDPADQKLIAQGIESVAQTGATEVGALYPGMGNNMHVAISGDSGVYEGEEWMREAYAAGKDKMLTDEQFQEWVASREEAKQPTAVATATPVNSSDYTQIDFGDARIVDNEDGSKTISWNGLDGKEISQTIQPNTLNPDFSDKRGMTDLAARLHYNLPITGMVNDQYTGPVPEPYTEERKEASRASHLERMSSETKPATATATPETQRISMGTMGGYNAAAGGAEITDPSMIISEDGKKVTRVAETGPEKISVMPRHKSSDVFQEQQVMFQQDREEKSREDIAKKDIAEVRSTPMMSNFGRPMDSGQSASINNSMPKISPSANKAFADAKMVGRFNKADVDGDMGIVYINRGYA